MKILTGKRALLTGAASGIGRALALELASRGTHLFLVDKNESGLGTLRAEIQERAAVEVHCCVCDLTSADEITQSNAHILETWGSLDILINNAGVLYYGNTAEMSIAQWNRILAVNLHAPIQFTREWLPVLGRQSEAHLLNVASFFALVPYAKICAYQTSKFGLLGFTQSLRAELRRTSIGVTAICPGFVSTPLYETAEYGDGRLRQPPHWLCTSADYVARKAIKAIARNKRLTLVTPLAHLAHWVQRLTPGVIDALYRIGRTRRTERPQLAISWHGKMDEDRQSNRQHQPEKIPRAPIPTEHVSDTSGAVRASNVRRAA